MTPESIEQIGVFAVKRLIGAGPSAEVFEVDDPRLEGTDAIRALKLLKTSACSQSGFDRFREEASLLVSLDHKNLIVPSDFGRDEATGRFFYTMNYAGGVNLADEIDAKGALTPDRCVAIFSAALSGLVALHSHARRIVHRDIKPANLLRDANGRTRLSEIGVVREHHEEEETQASFAVGTVRFMSPEQASGKDLDPRSDIFSLGLAMFEALSGKGLYERLDGIDPTNDFDVLGYLAMCGRRGEELQIDFENPRISRPLTEIIRKACRYESADRFCDAAEMRTALLNMSGSVDPSTIADVEREKGGRRIGWVAVAASMLAVAAWLLWPSARTDSELQVTEAGEVAESLAYLRKNIVEVDAVAQDFLRRIDAITDRAERGMNRARASLASGGWEAARISALDASEEMNVICREIGARLPDDEGLSERLDQKIERVKSLGAEQHTAGALGMRWGEVRQQYQALSRLSATGETAASAGACASNQARMIRRPILVSALVSATALEAELRETSEPTPVGTLQTREVARKLREKALQIGADRSAKLIFDQAESEYEAGTTARYSDRIEEARERYGRAIPLYQRAIADTTGSVQPAEDEPNPQLLAALRSGRAELKALQSELRFCGSLKSAASVSQCELARDESSKAALAMENNAPETSLDHIAASRSALKAALRSETAVR